MATIRDWEILPWHGEAEDRSDFDEEGNEPFWIWEEESAAGPQIKLSDAYDAYCAIWMGNAEEVNRLIRRLERARDDLFGNAGRDEPDKPMAIGKDETP